MAGLRLISSSRICELYSLTAGGERSYIASLRGADSAAGAAVQEEPSRPSAATAAVQRRLWVIEHTWAPQQAVPPAVCCRLLSLADRDELRLESLQLLPREEDHQGSALDEPEAPTAQLAGEESSQAAAAAGAAGVQPPAAVTSQLEGVRLMLSQLTAEVPGSSNGGSSSDDPKRALIAAIAKSVLQQPQPRQQQQQQQQQGGAAAPVTLVEDGQQQTGGGSWALAPTQLQQAVPAEAAAALQRLEERLGRLEALCGDMHAMLRQLVAAASVQQEHRDVP